MKQLFGPSRKKGEIAAGKIGVGMEAEAPKLAENKFRAPTTEDYLAQIQREQEGLIRGPEQVTDDRVRDALVPDRVAPLTPSFAP